MKKFLDLSIREDGPGTNDVRFAFGLRPLPPAGEIRFGMDDGSPTGGHSIARAGYGRAGLGRGFATPEAAEPEFKSNLFRGRGGG